METVINTDIKLALDFVQYTNRNIFLTGKAGTGKTTFLHDIKKSLPKRMIVLAPTGVAAINAGGVTIHSFFQLPLHPYVPSLYITNNLSGDHAEQQWSDIYKMSREKIKIIKSLDLLVIDEISMVRSDTLDAVDYLLRRYNDRYKPFGGVQLLMIGDLQQLAPVVKADDWEILKKYYSTGYFFGSKALHSTSYVTIELKHVYRQSDQSFIELLNKVRDNQIDTSVLNELNKRYDPSFGEDSDEGYITLTTHNYQAQAINDSKLEKLPGKAEMFKATIKDEFPDYSYPTASELLLKTGAQIMFVKNDPSGEKLFFNGKIGKIESLDNDLIEVKCPGDEFSIMVEKVEWQNMKYSLDEETKEIGETVVGTFTQFPLKLAWAITIHKSQGLTFEKAIIDASAAFAHGQVYVALSRCRTLSGIVLSTQVSTKSIVSDSQISGFVHETEQNQPDNNQLTESKKAYRKMLLTELFEFNHLLRNLYYCKKLTNEHRDSIIGNFPEIIDNTINSVNANLVEVSKKFYPQLMYLINSETADEYDGRLQERVIKASEFFTEKLNETMTEIMSGSTVETDNRTVRKAFLDVLTRIKEETIVKKACLNSVRSGFNISEYLKAKAIAAIDIPDVKKLVKKTAEDKSGVIKNADMFNKLKNWRDSKAKALNIPHYMILHQKTLATLASVIPRSLPAIMQIKGIGKNKAEKFGKELLEIIAAYCQEKGEESVSEPFIEAQVIKKVKKDTSLKSYTLFKEGKTISQIAIERGLTEATIERHLERYIAKGDIPVDAVVSQEALSLITRYYKENTDHHASLPKNALGDKVTWRDIKFVLKHLEFVKNSQTG